MSFLNNKVSILVCICISVVAGFIITSSMYLTFGLSVFMIGLIFLVRKPFNLIWIMFFVFMLWPYILYLTRIQWPFGIIFICLFSIFYLVYVLKVILDRTHNFPLELVDIINVSLILIGLFLFFISADKGIALIGLKENFKLSFVFLFIRAIRPTEKEIRQLLQVFLLISVLVALFGIYQYFFNYYWLIHMVGGITSTREKYLGLSPELVGHLGVKRAYSLFLNSFTLAYYLMISLLILVAKYTKSVYGKWEKLSLVFFPIILFCFALTFTRSAWMGFVFGTIIMLLIHQREGFNKRLCQLMIILIACIGFFSFVMPKEISNLILDRFTSIFSTDIRQTSWHYKYLGESIGLMFKHPLGLGLGKATAYIGEVWNESSLFKLATEMGIIPGLMFIAIFCLVVFRGLRVYKKAVVSQQETILITVGLTIAYFVSGIVFPVWMTWFPTLILWVLMANLFNIEINEKRSST